MPTAVLLLQNFLPTLLVQAPQLVLAFKETFVSIGGTDAEFEQALIDNGADIAILQSPDQLRHNIHPT